jgi:predicted PurR-regulated permease PerM
MSDTLAWAIRSTGLKVPTPVFRPIGEGATAEHAAAVQSVKESGSTTAVSTTVLATLAVLYTLFFASALILPVVASVLLSFLLRGPVRRLKRRGVSEPVGAGFVVFGAVLVALVAVALLSGPATTWVERAPAALGEVEQKVRTLAAPLLRWEATAARVTQLGSAPGTTSGPAPVVESAAQPGLLRRAFGSVATALGTSLTVIFLTYFLLASGDLFMRKLQKVLPGSDEAPGPRKLSEDVEDAVSTYLRTSVLINIGLGLATWGLLSALKMPNAGLFGALAGLLNFVPYVGALVTTAILSVAALTVFDSTGRAVLVPGAYLLLNLIESNAVTPLLMGRQFPLNAVALFGGVLFWGALWGIPGAILAVPITVTVKLLADTIPSMHLLAEFLGE